MSDGDDALIIGNGNPFMVPPTVPVAAAASAAPANVLSTPGTTPPELAVSSHPLAPSGFLSVAPDVDVDHFDPTFSSKAQALQQWAKANDIETTITSGARSGETQRQLWMNHNAKVNGQPIPYPNQAVPDVVASPGHSLHEFVPGKSGARAMDMYAKDPSKQALIDAQAEKLGLVPGSQFGDSGHYQLGGAGAPMRLASAAAPGDAATSPSASAASSGFNPKGLYTMAMLSSMFPNHKFSPVEYDPFKVMPHQGGVEN